MHEAFLAVLALVRLKIHPLDLYPNVWLTVPSSSAAVALAWQGLRCHASAVLLPVNTADANVILYCAVARASASHLKFRMGNF